MRPEATPTLTQSCSRSSLPAVAPVRCAHAPMRDLDPPCVTDGSEHPASVVIELGLVPTNPPHLGTDRCPQGAVLHAG